jgi:AcrR family transcriptional regulator
MVSLITMKVNVDSQSYRSRVKKHPQPSLTGALNQRARSVLKAAGEVFLAHGYAGTSLEMIVAKSGGSFRDLYQVFGGKESLFMRVMADLCEEVLSPLRHMALKEGSKQQPIDEVLLTMGTGFVRMLLSRRVISFHRLIVSESPRFPALGKLFFQMGPGSVNETVADFLKARGCSEGLVLPEPRAAAAIFLNSSANELHLRALTGGKVTNSEVEYHVREAVRIFLDGVRQPRS